MRTKSIIKINRSNHNQYKSSTYGKPKASFSIIVNSIKIQIQRLKELQSFESMIPKIVNSFLSNHQDQTKATLFKFRFKNHLQGSYLDILLLLREFPDFSIYNYISVTSNTDIFTQDKKETLKLLFISRNNIILNILLIATEYHFDEINKEISFGEDNYIFNDLSFLNSTIDELRNLIIDDNQAITIEYDVELFFLALLGFKELSNMIKQKHFKYFKYFLEECDLSSSMTFELFLNVTLTKKEFNEYKTEEIILFRKILNNTAKRKLYYGIRFLLKNVEYSYLLSEGRIWKSIGQKLSHDQVYNLWLAYREYLDLLRNTDLKETLSIEYKKRLILLSLEIKINENTHKKTPDMSEKLKRMYYLESKLSKEIQLYHVTCLKELLVIFFQNDLKELVQYFFDEFKLSKKDIKIPIDIYEICLDYDEDISM